MRSDVIYVLDQGRIVDKGTHDELLEHHGLYRKLFEDQNEALLNGGLLPKLRMGGNGDEEQRPNGAASAGVEAHTRAPA
jgi:hypothetical protein